MENEFLGLLLDDFKSFMKVYKYGNIFIDTRCRKIFNCMIDLYDNGIKITPESIEVKLKDIFSDEIMNLKLLADSRDLFDDRFETLRKSYLHRKASYVMSKYENYTADEFTEKLQDSMVLEKKELSSYKTPKDMHSEIIQNKPDQKVLSGIDYLDYYGGIRKASLVIIGARPKTGKTSLMVDMYRKMKPGFISTGVFSMEWDGKDFDSKWMAGYCDVSSELIYDKKLNQRQDMKVAEWMDKTKDWPLYLKETEMDITTLIREIRYLYKKGVRRFFIDHLHHIKVNRNMTSIEKLSYIVDKLNSIKKELGITIFLLAQVNRDNDKSGRPPRISDIKGCGDIEQKADLIVLLHEDKTKDTGSMLKGYIDLYITNRYGPGGKRTTMFYKHTAVFKDLKGGEE